jgi:hypothetical protein
MAEERLAKPLGDRVLLTETESKDDSDDSNEVDKKEIEEKEYILRVDLNNYILDMKIVDNISDNFKNEYLEGMIYVSIENDNYHITHI